MKKSERKPLWQVLCIFAAIFLVLSIFLGLVFQFYVTPKAEADKVGYYSVASKTQGAQIPLKGQFTYTQSFVAKDSISGYGLFINFTQEKADERARLAPNGEFIDVEGDLRITLKDQAGTVVDDYILNQDTLNEALYFTRLVRTFDTMLSGNVRGQTYTMEIVGDFPEDSGVYFCASENDIYQDGALYLNGAFAAQDLSFYVYSPIYTMVRLLFLAFSVGLLAAFTIVYFCACVFRVKKHILFLVTVLVMGIGYTALFTPFTVPDEVAHYYTAYRASNALTFTQEAEDPSKDVYVRACDTDYNGVISNFYGKHLVPTVSTYAAAINNILGVNESEELILLRSNYISGNLVCYTLAGIGITIGRWLHLSSALTFYLARFMNLLLFAVLGTLAVRKMPFGKNILFAVALLPLTLQQVASISYDSVIISFAFYFIATCMEIAYCKDKLRVADILRLLLCAMVFCAPKAGIYILLIGFTGIILLNQSMPKKHKWALVGTTVAGALLLLVILNYWRVAESGTSAVGQYYSLDYVFKDPKGFVTLWVNTYFSEKENLMFSLFGSNMAWINLPVEKTFAPVFVTLLCAASMRGTKEIEPHRMHKLDKGFIVPVVLLTIAGFCAAAFTWVIIGETYVSGLQTRYILPVLPLILLLMRSDTIVCRKDITNLLTVALVLTNAFYIVDLLRVILLA